RLRIEIMVEGLDAIHEPNVHVTVGSSLSQCVFRISSRMVPLETAHTRSPQETIVIDIPSLPLTPGDYHLDLGIHDLRDGTALDEVRKAAGFSVIPADVLGTGYQYAPKDGYFMVPWEWELQPSNAD